MQIGIDSTDGDIKIVGISRGTVLVETSVRQAASSLSKTLAEGVACTAAATPASTLFVPLNTPAIKGAKLKKILPSLLDIQIPLPIADCVYTFIQYRTDYAAYAIRKADIKTQLDSLNEMGCNPCRLVPMAHAAWMLSLAEFPLKRPNEPRALFVAGAQQTVLISGCGEAVEKQSVFKTAAAEPVRRLKLAFGGVPENLVCIVAGAEHQSVVDALEAPDANLSANVITAPSPPYFIARALARDGKNDGGAEDTNLRTGAFAHALLSRREMKPAFYLKVTLVVASIVILAASISVLAITQKAEEQSKVVLQNRLQEIAGFSIKSKGQRALQDARSAMPLRLDDAILSSIENRIPQWLSATTTICLQHNIKLQHLSITVDGLTASGVASSANAAHEFVSALASAGINATLTEPPKAIKDGTFTFFVLPAKP